MTLWAGGVIWGDWAALKGVYQILVQNTLYPQPRKLMDNHQLSLICMWTCSQPLGARGGMIWGKYISNHASPGATTCNKSVFRKWPKYCKLTWKCQFVFADPLFFLHNIKTVLLTVHIWGRGGVNHLGSDTLYQIQTNEPVGLWRHAETGHWSMLFMAPEFVRSGRLVPLIEVASVELLIAWPNGEVYGV